MKIKERRILNLIKYIPVLLTLIISGVLTFYLYFQNIERFKLEAQKLEKKYIEINKDLIKFQVQKIKQTILDEKANQRKKLKKELKLQVDNAYNIALSIYKNNQDKKQNEIIKLIKDALRDIRFNEERGYLFIYSMLGTNILHPIKTNLENKNMWNYKDKKGTFLIQRMNEILSKKDSTFYKWYWAKDENQSEELEKVGYFKFFEPFNWFIGTGEYIKDFDIELKNSLSKKLSEYHYRKESYIFALDYDGNYISYHNKNAIGKNIKDLMLVRNPEKMMKEMKKKSEIKAGFMTYTHNDKPITKAKNNKISYVDGIKDWKWIIGTGFYMDDFYKEMEIKNKELLKTNNEELKQLLYISFTLTLILLLVLIYISKILESEFIKYTKEIEHQIKKNIKTDRILAHQSKMAAMGEMIGNIAHQWRQPLSTISTITTGIKVQRENGILDKDFENDAMDKINKHVQYLSQTIDDFRNYFKTTKTINEFKFSALFKKSLNLIETKCTENDIFIIEEIDDIVLNTLENELLQVLINILNNAIDAVSKIDTKKYIFINSKVLDNKFMIEIKDNGNGLDLNNTSKIFEPYFTTKEKSQGTGIGLFMSEQIISNHLGGYINVKNVKFEYNSSSYKGALFQIILPIEKKEKEIEQN